MAFQSLISGAECGPVNPLAQIVKHSEGDRSLQRDRLAGPSQSSIHHLPSTSRSVHESDLASARQFFEGNPDALVHAHTPPPSFHAFTPPHMQPHMHSQPGQQGLENWQLEARARLSAAIPGVGTDGGAWAQQFSPHEMSPASQMHSPVSGASYMNQGFMSRPYHSGFSAMHSGPQFGSAMTMPGTSLKGKGRATDADFEAAFAAAERQSAHVVEKDDDQKVDELVNSLAKASVVEEDEQSLDTDFQRVWDQLQNSELPPDIKDLAKWEAEYNAMMSAQRDELLEGDSLEEMEKAWAEANIEGDNGFGLDRFKLDQDGRPNLGDYEFDPNNPHLHEKAPGSRLAEAKSLMEANGSLTEAALLFEAAIQEGDVGKGGYEAWILLGEVKAMDEMETQGLKALTQGVKVADQVGDHGEGMLSLAVAYTNESYDRASQMTLLAWLKARFPTYVSSLPPVPDTSATMPWALHEAITDAFLHVARSHYEKGNPPDADLQVGLGILYYTNGEFEKAADCFGSALGVRPTDYLLWNRYGSCLSNGSKPEEALGAYRQALSLRPTYTRAIYNVGVACLNIGALKEAVEHFLSALALQGDHKPNAGDGGVHAPFNMKSEQTWSTLRRTLIAMDRADLVERSRMGDLEVFRTEGFDF